MHHAAARDRCLVDLTAHLRAGRDALAQLQTAMDIAALRAAADEADSDFDVTKTIFASTLHEHRCRAQAASDEFDDFRARHALTRNARLPANRGLSWAIMALLVVVEGAFNAFFFASASDLGLLGGAIVAIMFSIVNVAVGVLNGWFPLRWANHKNMAIKLTGLVAFPALCIASLILNGFVAHYRDVSQAAPDTEPLFEAFIAMMRDPFGLRSIESWFLLALGLLCAGFAIVKGYGLDDPYPRYGAAERRRKAAQDDYEGTWRQAIAQVTQFRDDFTSELRVKIETLRGSSTQRQQILAGRARHLTEFEAHESHLAQAAQQLLSIYRQANQAARSTANPAHFTRRFTFPDHAIARPAIRSLLEDQGLEVNAERLIQELDGLRRDVMTKYSAMLREHSAEPAR